MNTITLLFQVKNQEVINKTRSSTVVVTKSKNLYYAEFIFSELWDGVVKHVQFSRTGVDTADVIIVDGFAKIPNTMCAAAGTITVSVYGGNIVTSIPAEIEVTEGSYDESAATPADDPEALHAYVQTPTGTGEVQYIKRENGVLMYYNGNVWISVLDAYQSAVSGGYTGTQAEFEAMIAALPTYSTSASASATAAAASEATATAAAASAAASEAGAALSETAAALSEATAATKASEAAASASESNVGAEVANEEATRATNNILNGVSTHNSDSNSHPSILNELSVVKQIALDAKSTITFETYWAFIFIFNSLGKNPDKYYVGKGINIVKTGVPDLWIAYIVDTYIEYVYTSEAAFEADLREHGTVQVGYYKIAMMETGKVDLSDYYNKEQVNNLLPKTISETEYNTKFNDGTLPVGQYFIQIGV